MMGCGGGCGGARAAAANTYPREAMMPDGSRTTVTSAADEKAQRERVFTRMRQEAVTKGYRSRPA